MASSFGASQLAEALRQDALAGLTSSPKEMPPKWFYDEQGSGVFDETTRLPECYLARAEREILERRATPSPSVPVPTP